MCEVTINRGGIVRRNSEHEKERQRLDYKKCHAMQNMSN